MIHNTKTFLHVIFEYVKKMSEITFELIAKTPEAVFLNKLLNKLMQIVCSYSFIARKKAITCSN